MSHSTEVISLPTDVPPSTVEAVRARDRRRWRLAVVGVVAVALVSGAVDLVTPSAAHLPAALLLIALVAIAMRPTLGIHVVVVGALLSDISVAPWYPFVKNFSSEESVLFVSARLIMNPLEVVLVATTLSWFSRRLVDPRWRVRRGALFAPLAVFMAFVALGLVNGFAGGGDVQVGLWELRPLVYLAVIYALVTNVFTTRRQYVNLFWSAVSAITVHAIVAVERWVSMDPEERAITGSLTEHAAAVHMNVIIVAVLAAWLFGWTTSGRRVALTVMAVPVVWAYILSERRSAFIGLSLAIVLMAVVLFVERRRVFWRFAPVVAVIATGYTVVFWNVQGGLGFPAQALKSAIAPGQLEGADLTSNIYREIEAINIWFTIRVGPVRGVGFGQPFYRPYPLADISFFPFWEYMPHNSFLWIWLKTGFAGFASMIYLMIRTLQYGARTVRRVPEADRLLALVSVLYVAMYLIFSYVDIGWDTRSTVFLGVAMAICADFRHLPRDDETVAASADHRWSAA